MKVVAGTVLTAQPIRYVRNLSAFSLCLSVNIRDSYYLSGIIVQSIITLSHHYNLLGAILYLDVSKRHEQMVNYKDKYNNNILLLMNKNHQEK